MGDLREDALWGMIRRTAKKDPELQDMLDKVIMFYLLKHKDAK